MQHADSKHWKAHSLNGRPLWHFRPSQYRTGSRKRGHSHLLWERVGALNAVTFAQVCSAQSHGLYSAGASGVGKKILLTQRSNLAESLRNFRQWLDMLVDEVRHSCSLCDAKLKMPKSISKTTEKVHCKHGNIAALPKIRKTSVQEKKGVQCATTMASQALFMKISVMPKLYSLTSPQIQRKLGEKCRCSQQHTSSSFRKQSRPCSGS